MDSRRFIFFGGQGSRLLSSSSPSVCLSNNENASNVNLFMSACHAAFLQEALRSRSHGPVPLWAQFSLPAHPEALLKIPTEYCDNPIFQGVCLCVNQLRTYLVSNPDIAIDTQSVTGGFCSGMIPAVVLSSSTTLDDFIRHSTEAVRLAYWIGFRAGELSEQIGGEEWQRHPWAVSVFKPDKEQLEQAIASFNTRVSGKSGVCMASRLGQASFSVVGPGHLLKQFQEQCHSLGWHSERVFVHALYHGNVLGMSAMEKVLQDVKREGIVFPSTNDLKKPLLSCRDGHLLKPSPTRLLDYILQIILVDPIDLCAIWSGLTEVVQSSSSDWIIMTIGPGANGLLSIVSRDFPQLTKELLVDLPGLEKDQSQSGFAIVGMSVNLPGGSSKEEFWSTLENGLNTVDEIPSSRFKTEPYQSGANRLNSHHGNFLQDPFAFDHQFFGISPREAKSMDPQQKLLLHGAVNALDDSGYVPNLTPSLNPDTIGCYIGVATDDYVQNLARQIDVYYSTGTLRAFLSGKISYAHGWSGPSIVVDTACSSSSVAIASACRALAHGDCSAALAGGVNVITSPNMYLGLSRAHFLSPTGQCRPFDESADGYCRAEGCVLFVIKRLQDAIDDNDRIYGAIRAVEANQSGNTSSITHPHEDTQVQLLQKLLSRSKVDSRSISVIEAHGTGTQAGDTTETASIKSVFADSPHPIHLTSIKGNIGHAEAASGSASLAKLLLMLNYSKIPPQVGLSTLNPNIQDLTSHNIKISTQLLNWPSSSRPRRALINNFGAAGSNVALILEEFRDSVRKDRGDIERKAYNWIVSAKTAQAIHVLVEWYRQMLSKGEAISISNLCYTATTRRQLYDYRLSLVVENVTDLVTQLASPSCLDAVSFRSPKPDPVVFVFSGQGGFHLGMGRQLLNTAPVFRNKVIECDKILQRLGHVDVRPSQVLDGIADLGAPTASIVCSQVGCFVLEIALAALLQSWGIKPDILIGHSLGEYAAMVVSRVLSLRDALWLVVYRAELMATRCTLGRTTMITCNQSTSYIKVLLMDLGLSDLSIACDNSETASVVSGPVDAVQILAHRLKEQNMRCKVLDVPLGFHSAALDPILEPLKKFAQKLSFSTPQIPLASCLYGRIVGQKEIDASYITRQTRNTVRFTSLISSLAEDAQFQSASFIELGPAPITLPMIQPSFASTGSIFLPCLVRNMDPWTVLCRGLQQLSFRYNGLSWTEVFRGTNARIIDLPGYPFQYSSLYVDYQEPRKIQGAQPNDICRPSGFFLLGEVVKSPGPDNLLECRTDLAKIGEYIHGHVVAGNALCPASVYHTIVLEALHWEDYADSHSIAVVTDITFEAPLIDHKSDEQVSVHLSVKKDSEEGRFIFSKQNAASGCPGPDTLCVGKIAWRSASDVTTYFTRKLAYIKRQLAHLQNYQAQANVLHKNLIYNVIFPRVVSYSEQYQSITQLSVADNGLEGHGKCSLPPNNYNGDGLPPAFVDTLLHGAGFLANSQARANDAFICSKVDSVVVLYKNIELDQMFTFYCGLLDCGNGELLGEAYAINSQEAIVASIEGMHFKRLNLRAFTAYLSRQITSGQKQSHTSVPMKRVPRIPKEPDNRPNGIEQVIAIILEVCEQQPTCDIMGSSRLEDLGVDSLMRIELVQLLQAHYSGVCAEDIASADTVEGIWKCINARARNSDSSCETNTDSIISTPPAGSEPDVSSASDVTGLLMKIIHTACEVELDNLAPSTRLDALGIDSLMTIELQDTLCRYFGDHLPQFDMSGDTIAELSKKVAISLSSANIGSEDTIAEEHRGTTTPAKPTKSGKAIEVQLLQTGAENLPPLILFHDGSGMVDQYRKLGPLGCTLFAVQNPFLTGGQHWASSLEDMARHYATALLTKGMPDKIILGGKQFTSLILSDPANSPGWSFGGVLAHEVACQLDSQSSRAIAVLLIDSPCPQDHDPLPVQVVEYILGKTISSRGTLSTLKSQFHHHAQFLAAHRPHKSSSSRNYYMLQSHNLMDTTSLCGVQYPWLESAEARAISIQRWQILLGRPLSVMEIPGNHFESFHDANIEMTSEKIRQTYREIVG